MDHRPTYYDEIETICDVGVADENARLLMESEGGLTHEGESPMPEWSKAAIALQRQRQEEPSATEASVRQLDELKERITGDEFHSMIETAAPTSPHPVVREHVESIRASLVRGTYPEAARADVGYLLEVIDALEAGRL